MKKLAIILMLAAISASASSEGLRTAGDGTTYTLDILSTIDGSGVEKWVDEDDGEVTYMLLANDTIAIGDKFVMDDGVSVLFDDNVTLVIEGDADFRLTLGSTFDSAYDGADYVSPVGIRVEGGSTQTMFRNCSFYYVGLRCTSAKGMSLEDCAFWYNNGAIGQAALTLGPDGAPFSLKGCTFGYNKKAAIAGAANYRNPLLIEGCTFIGNGQANGNIPQLNLTVADSVVVRGCTIEGDPEKTMVGAIVVANLMNYDGNFTTIIDGNTISDCRFGIATYMKQNVRITNNTLLDNCHEANPMYGGSGINVNDPYYLQYTYIEGNHIEGSLWGITLVGGREANLGHIDVEADDPSYNPGRNTFVNNGNNGLLYDLYNNSTNTVYAQGNRWNVNQQTEEKIEEVVFHQHDNASLGKVIFMPAAETTAIAAHPHSAGNTTAGYDLLGRAGSKSGILIVNGRKIAAGSYRSR